MLRPYVAALPELTSQDGGRSPPPEIIALYAAPDTTCAPQRSLPRGVVRAKRDRGRERYRVEDPRARRLVRGHDRGVGQLVRLAHRLDLRRRLDQPQLPHDARALDRRRALGRRVPRGRERVIEQGEVAAREAVGVGLQPEHGAGLDVGGV